MDDLSNFKDALAERYAIEREIGAGGMATIHLARDLRHDRTVAIKVLNRDIAAELGAQRFLAEIKVTANLRHPNLLPLYDSGEAAGRLFYVMPFIDGESLRARLQRERQLPLDDTLHIAVGVANALAYVHEHGVIHRDLKPENILLENGDPLVADFGISLAVKRARDARMTQTGMSIGTPMYMSPEQAIADPVIDHRTDIYSLGAITYEMLTGEAPYSASSPQAIYARMLMERPRSIRSIRPAVPEHVEAAVMRALEQLPADRFSSARQFADALLGRTVVTGASTHSAPSLAGEQRKWRWKTRDTLIIAAVVVVIGSLLAATAFNRRNDSPETPVIRFVIATPDSAPAFDNPPWPAAISPDGSTIVYSVRTRTGTIFYLLRTDHVEGKPIPGTENAAQPVFSPDGQWLAFETNTPARLRKVRLDGSAPITLANVGSGNGCDWTIDGQIIVGAETDARALSRLSAGGGDLVDFAKPDRPDTYYLWPIAFPDGKLAVFTIFRGSLEASELATVPIEGGDVVPLKLPGVRPLAVLDNVLVYVRADGAVMAVRLDRSRRSIGGQPIPVLDPIPIPRAMNGNSGVFVSRSGALVSQRTSPQTLIGTLSSDGQLTTLPIAARPFETPRFSPDGKRVAIVYRDEDKRTLAIYDMTNGLLRPLVTADAVASPSWTPDGRTLVYLDSWKGVQGVWSKSVDEETRPQKLFDTGGLTGASTVSPDGHSVLLVTQGSGSWDLLRVPLDSPHVFVRYLNDQIGQTSPVFSPDSHWLAWQEGAPAEIYVSSFPVVTRRFQISAGGGTEPLWSRDGSTIFYRADSSIIAARVDLSSSPRVISRSTVVAKSPFVAEAYDEVTAPTDVGLDGKFVGRVPTRTTFQLVAVPNWRTELARHFASGSQDPR